ncbi:MAG: U32 family peptidase [Candidatus Omnitrophica bacterium]|jgi:collagenase-like PrtC family protease|nr:U32 family peptidase [Candidatus Omnitrophota bacterium]
MLKIIAPLREKNEVSALIEAGADELYCGYLSREWAKTFTPLEFERKGHRSNFTDLLQLKQAVGLAHKNGVPVFLALNGLYVREQYPLLLKTVRELEQTGLDGYIVADLGLLLTLNKLGTKKELHLSTGATVFNSRAAGFFRDLGVSRIVLDRQTDFDSMREICRDNPGIDFEAFVLFTLCVYIDGFCTFLHAYTAQDRQEAGAGRRGPLRLITTYDPYMPMDACRMKFRARAFKGNRQANRPQPVFYKHLVDSTECGACALYDLARIGIKAVKIVGRQLNSEDRVLGTGFIRRCLDILRDQPGISRRDFNAKVQERYRKSFAYRKKCRGNNCYFPEVLSA